MVHPLARLPQGPPVGGTATLEPPRVAFPNVEPEPRRCDADSAEAAVCIVYVTDANGADRGEISLCGHHLRAHAANLLAYDAVALVPGVDSWPYTIGKRWEHSA